MAVRTKGETSELQELERQAVEHLAEDSLNADEDQEGLTPLDETTEGPIPVLRLASIVGCSVLSASVMIGGIFKGISPRIWAALAGLLGIALVVLVMRVRNLIGAYVVMVGGILLIGIILVIPAGSFEDVINISAFVKEAATSGDVQRPPVAFTFGWQAIVAWLMAALGFSAAWVAMQLRKPGLGLMLPMILVAVGAISVSEDAKIPSGLASLVLFAIGLGLLSGIEMGEGEQRSLGYELRRAARAVPLIVLISVVLFFMARSGFLFPKPLYDPTQDAQRPKTVPITEVPDRVLFTVKSSITGPWRMGGLDVYKDNEWLLPPFADSQIEEVQRSGIVDSELDPGVRAEFDIKDVGGAVLPGLPNLVGLVAEGPRLAYDSRTGNIRLAEGTVQAGLVYTVTAARIPTVEELQRVNSPPPKELAQFTDIPPAPPAVLELLGRSPHTSLWDKLDFVRQEFLRTVVARGAGTPVPVPAEKVTDMISGSKSGTPFEIVAAQAMLARWLGIPARIGYGFDGGEKIGDVVEVRPKHGASFLEVYFPSYKWLPIIGTPLQAQSSVASEFTQTDETVLPSDEVAVRIYVPYQTDPRTYLFEQIRAVLVVIVPIVLVLLALYYSWPAARKAWIRSRRRSWAQSQGPRERISVTYSEWRDLATDFGYQYSSNTPLMFLDRVVKDEEHTELAWLVTRGLWGDLQGSLRSEDASAAEELSQALRKRLNQAHSFTLRFIAAVSRLSLRDPYAPNIDALLGEKKGSTSEKKAA
jgi:hypothetical protein